MSRIGNLPIDMPEGVELNVSPENIVTVKGPKGELEQSIDPAIKIKIEDNQVVLQRETEQIDHKAKHGLSRSLISNMITGVSTGYKTEQELVGVGYRANVKGQQLELTLGFSHLIIFEIPSEIKVTAQTEKGQPPLITLESYDKQLIGQVAAKIRSFRKPEPYKGKGIRFKGEHIRRKAGKTAAS